MMTDYESLSRRELQALAKKAGIRANQKSVEIIDQLIQLDASNYAASPCVVTTTWPDASGGSAEVADPNEPMEAADVYEGLTRTQLPSTHGL